MKTLKIKKIKTAREKSVKDRKYQAAAERATAAELIEVPDRMDLIFIEIPYIRYIVLTPKELNAHQQYFTVIPVTIERTTGHPFEYPFIIDRLNQIALCDQIQTLELKGQFHKIGKLSRDDHNEISRKILKIIGDPRLADRI